MIFHGTIIRGSLDTSDANPSASLESSNRLTRDLYIANEEASMIAISQRIRLTKGLLIIAISHRAEASLKGQRRIR